MEDIKKIVSVLGSLVLAHQKRINAYLLLSQTTSQEGIKLFCERQVNYSNRAVQNLSTWRSAYGPFAEGLDYSECNSSWDRARLLISFNPEKTMITRCEQLEREIVKMYQLAIPLIPSLAIGDLQSQMKELGKTTYTFQGFRERRSIVPQATSFVP